MVYKWAMSLFCFIFSFKDVWITADERILNILISPCQKLYIGLLNNKGTQYTSSNKANENPFYIK